MSSKSIFIFYSAGRGGLQLLSGRPVAGGYPYTWHTCRSVYLDWSFCGPKGKAKCFWYRPGKHAKQLMAFISDISFYLIFLMLTQKSPSEIHRFGCISGGTISTCTTI